MDDILLVERAGGIVTVILNRPDKRNAFNLAMCARMTETFAELSADGTVRCVVLRGAGDRAFTAGADIKEYAAMRTDAANARAYNEKSALVPKAIRACRHPTIAMIRGFCMGGGCSWALACDIRFAAASSRFGIPANRLSNYYSYDSLEPLIAAVGRFNALELMLGGHAIDAAEARRIGLVNRVYPDETLAAETMAFADEVAAGAPLANWYHKKAIHRLADPRPLSRTEMDEEHGAFETEDYRIGYTAFLNKEKPRFVGR
ncbi:MAG: enoyl-CoA hydratase/isomerase family protein [Proteobacteria bacterium]|nr:enoyl-CoA hydratase/isomerase family protein [Pseudomonadota bacterium]